MAIEEDNAQAPSPDLSRPNAVLTLEDVNLALEEVFEDDLERRWVIDAWTALIELGFANYSNELERCEAAINLIAFAEFYRDWKAMVEDASYRAFGSGDLPNVLNLSPFRLGLLIGQQPDFLQQVACDDDLDWDSDSDLFRAALSHLEREARPRIVSALEQYHGGQSGLFVALWNSDKQPRPAGYEENRQEFDYDRDLMVGELQIWEPAYQETDDEILNDVTDEKLRLWTWLEQGAEPLDRC
jgi:hypothetical protein